MRIRRKGYQTAALMLAWTALVVAFFIMEQWTSKPDVVRGDTRSIEQYLGRNLRAAGAERHVGCAALILVNAGEISSVQTFAGSGLSHASLNADQSLFLLCSVSKAVSTWGALKLVEEGRITLDEPVLPHLRRWRFPGSEKYRDRVTLRHLLSHTSGLVDGFGFSGFPLDSTKQTLEESLDGPTDANMGTSHAAILVNEPGTSFSYSSAGYSIIQLLIEELTGKSFNDYMKENILLPLGMVQSNYEVEEIVATGRMTNLVPNYDGALQSHPHRKHTMMAGGSLRTTPADFARFLAAYHRPNGVLSQETVAQMFVPQPGTGGIWGLGHEISLSNQAGGHVVGHGGGAFPRTGAAFRFNPATGNGVVVFMTGGTEMIDDYTDAWLYWETGASTFDIRNVVRKRIYHVVAATAVGCALIILIAIRRRQSATRDANT